MLLLLPLLSLTPMLLLPGPLVRIDGAIVPELLEKLEPLDLPEPLLEEDELDGEVSCVSPVSLWAQTPSTSSVFVVATVERIPGRVRTVALHVPTTNTLLVDGVWAHNDSSSFAPSILTSTSGSSSSSSGSSKSSGSTFSSSSGTIAPSILTSGGSSSIGVSDSNGSSNNTAA